MNYNQRFDGHIKEQFLDYTPPVHPRIWENIAGQREKKRPVGFWFGLFSRRNILLLAGLLLVAGGGAYFLLKETSPGANNAQTTAVTSAEKSPAANEETAVSSNTLKPAEAVAATAPAVTSNAAPADKLNSNAGTGNVIINNTNEGKNNNPASNAAAATNDNLFSFTGSSKKYSNAAKQKIKIKNGVAVFTEDDPATEEEAAAYSLPYLFFTAEKNTSLKTAATLSRRNTSNVKEPGCPTIEKNAAGNKTYIEVYGGPDIAFRSMSDTGNSVYLQKRKESTKFSSAFSAGIRYTKVFNNGVSIRTGINYSQINEKFTYSEGNIVQVVYIINASGDTIGSYTTTGSRYKTTFNKFKTLDIPVVLGYELGNGNFHTNINAGVIINAYSWQKGEVLDGSLQPVNITTGKSNSPYQYKTNIGAGFIGSVSVYYKLNEKLHLMAEPYFRYNLTPASKEIITFKQKYNTAGLRLGLRLDIR